MHIFGLKDTQLSVTQYFHKETGFMYNSTFHISDYFNCWLQQTLQILTLHFIILR